MIEFLEKFKKEGMREEVWGHTQEFKRITGTGAV